MRLARPLVRYVLRHAFVRFALVGACGYVVDTAMLWFATSQLGLDAYSGRALSILTAMLVTWQGNRRITFARHAARGSAGAVLHEFLRFLGANAVGAVANYALYAGLIRWASAPFDDKYVAQALGVLLGMLFNFTLSRSLVFRPARPARSVDSGRRGR